MRAGLPIKVVPASAGRATTAPAATEHRSPMLAKTTAFSPIQQSFPILGGSDGPLPECPATRSEGTRPQEHVTVEQILKSVANYYNLKVSDLKSPRRHKSIAGPRAVAMYLARTHTKDSYPDLGRGFGGKHHTTVISAVEKITKKLKIDATLRGEIHAIEGVLLR